MHLCRQSTSLQLIPSHFPAAWYHDNIAARGVSHLDPYNFFLPSYKGFAFAKTVWQRRAGCSVLISSSAVCAAPSKCTTSFKAQHVFQSTANACLSANEKAGQEPKVKDPGCRLLLRSTLFPSILISELLPRPGASPECLVPLCGLAGCAMINEFLLFLIQTEGT